MPNSTRIRLKSLEAKAAPFVASEWLRRQIESKQNDGRILDSLYLLINWGVLLCPNEDVEHSYERHYQSNRYAQKDEKTDRTEYAIAALSCIIDTFSIYKQTPAEVLTPNAKETLAEELQDLLSHTRPDVKGWSTKTLFRALSAMVSYVEQYPHQPGSGRVIVDTVRFIQTYEPIHYSPIGR